MSFEICKTKMGGGGKRGLIKFRTNSRKRLVRISKVRKLWRVISVSSVV